jgi:hypothetical protein
MSHSDGYLVGLHKETREELIRVDGKIGVLLRAFLVAVAVVAAGIIAGNWRPSNLDFSDQIVWWCGVALVVVALIRLVAALVPRTLHSKPPQGVPRYYADIASLSSADDLIAILDNASESARIADQTYELSKIVVRKYRTITQSTWTYAVGVGAASLSVILG